jgi:DNA repair exonuclease SbcCD ATPase subunit
MDCYETKQLEEIKKELVQEIKKLEETKKELSQEIKKLEETKKELAQKPSIYNGYQNYNYIENYEEEQHKNKHVDFREGYFSNFLPEKIITGYEEFDNDAFNAEFEKTLNISNSQFGNF